MELQLKLLACLICLQMIGYRNLCIECVDKVDQKPFSVCKVFLLWTSRMEGNQISQEQSGLDTTNEDFCYMAEEKCPEYKFAGKHFNLHSALESKSPATRISVCEFAKHDTPIANSSEHIGLQRNFIAGVGNVSSKIFHFLNKKDGYIELKLTKKLHDENKSSDSYNAENYSNKLKKNTFFITKHSLNSSVMVEEIESVNLEQFNIVSKTDNDQAVPSNSSEDLGRLQSTTYNNIDRSLPYLMYVFKIKRDILNLSLNESKKEVEGKESTVEHSNIGLESEFPSYPQEESSESDTANKTDEFESIVEGYTTSYFLNEIDNDGTVIDFPLLDAKNNKIVSDRKENSSDEFRNKVPSNFFLFVIELSTIKSVNITANDTLLNDKERPENTRKILKVYNKGTQFPNSLSPNQTVVNNSVPNSIESLDESAAETNANHPKFELSLNGRNGSYNRKMRHNIEFENRERRQLKRSTHDVINLSLTVEYIVDVINFTFVAETLMNMVNMINSDTPELGFSNDQNSTFVTIQNGVTESLASESTYDFKKTMELKQENATYFNANTYSEIDDAKNLSMVGVIDVPILGVTEVYDMAYDNNKRKNESDSKGKSSRYFMELLGIIQFNSDVKNYNRKDYITRKTVVTDTSQSNRLVSTADVTGIETNKTTEVSNVTEIIGNRTKTTEGTDGTDGINDIPRETAVTDTSQSNALVISDDSTGIETNKATEVSNITEIIGNSTETTEDTDGTAGIDDIPRETVVTDTSQSNTLVIPDDSTGIETNRTTEVSNTTEIIGTSTETTEDTDGTAGIDDIPRETVVTDTSQSNTLVIPDDSTGIETNRTTEVSNITEIIGNSTETTEDTDGTAGIDDIPRETVVTDTSQSNTLVIPDDSTGIETNKTTEVSNITEIIGNSTETTEDVDGFNITSLEIMNTTVSSSTSEVNTSDATTIVDSSTATTMDSCANPCIDKGLYGDNWTGCPGTLVVQECPLYSLGRAAWYCDANGGSFVGDMPEYSNCSHTWIDDFYKYILEGDDALWIASRIEIYSNFTSFFGHELTDLLFLLNCTFDLHIKQIENEIPFVKFSRSTLFTIFTTAALEKLLVSTAGMLQITESQRVFVGRLFTNLTTSVGFTLASSAANITENFNATFNSSTVVLFGVDVSDASSRNGTLVFPSEEGNNTGNSDMRSHISVDVGTHGEFKSPRSVGVLLDPQPASLLFPASRNSLVDDDNNNATKILNSMLLSFSLQDVDNGSVRLIQNLRLRSTGNEYPVKIMLRHENLAKGPTESVVRRSLYPGEAVTAVLGSARCVFWNTELGEGGLWDETGCRVESSDETHTQCACNHLSTFAVLMDVHDYVGKDATLELLSWAFTGASVICLILTLIVFQQCRSIQSERTRIGKNLCVCLVVGHLVALFFLDKSYINFSDVTCSFVAGALHYLFLASFCWMTVEGHHLYRMIVRVFDSGRDFRHWYLLVGYGIPGIIVLVTKLVALARDEKAYGRDELCWLSSPFYIWSFIGPVLLLSTINTIVLILALREAVFAGLNQGKSKRETAWIWIRGWFSLSALLGITWVFGLGYMEFNHSFVYIFVVLNGCQGVFIFLFRCVLSEQVRSTVVSSVKRDGLTVLFRGFPYSRSSLNVDSTRSDIAHIGGSSIVTVQSDSVQVEGDNHALWYVLTHNIADRQLQEVINTTVSCDLLQIHAKGTSCYEIRDEGVVSKSNLASCINEARDTDSSCREVANNTNIQQTINVTKTEVDASFFGDGNWRPSEAVDERINLSVITEPCWTPLRSVRHVSVTRYPTIDEESDPDC